MGKRGVLISYGMIQKDKCRLLTIITESAVNFQTRISTNPRFHDDGGKDSREVSGVDAEGIILTGRVLGTACRSGRIGLDTVA